MAVKEYVHDVLGCNPNAAAVQHEDLLLVEASWARVGGRRMQGDDATATAKSTQSHG